MESSGLPPALPALTSARFFAALVVVLHHYSGFLAYPPWLAVVAAHGQAGVCFFFVLSGFILTYNYHDWFASGVESGARRSFFKARFARVYPLHFLTLLVITPIVLGQWYGAPAMPSFKLLASSWLAHLALLQAWVPSPLLQNQWNAPSWSISTEFLFYLVFPFAVAGLLARWPRPRQLIVLGVAFVLLEAVATLLTAGLVAGGFQWPIGSAHGSVHWVISAWAPLRLGEFLVGCVLGALFLADRRAPLAVLAPFRHPVGRNLILVGALAAAYGLCWLPQLEGPVGFVLWVLRHNVLFVPCFALTILCLASGTTFASPLLERRVMLLLGEASYALYLIHFLPLLVLLYVVKPVGAIVPLATILLTIGLSIVSYLAFETPMRKWLRGSGASRGAGDQRGSFSS